jgi:tetratricopeptide (TPR) repeat protein
LLFLVSLILAAVSSIQLLTTSPTQLAAPAGGSPWVTSAIVGTVVLGLTVREMLLWSGERLAHRGDALFRAEKYAEALPVYDRLQNHRPYRVLAWSNTALTLQMLGRFDEALVCVNEALHLSPRSARLWAIKGQVLFPLGSEQEALDAVDYALKLAPRDGGIWMAQGVIFSQLERHREAREASERTLTLLRHNSPSSLRTAALATIALALVAEAQPEEALAQAEQAHALSPQAIRPFLAKAMALEQLGRAEEMRTAAERGLRLVEEEVLVTSPGNVELVQLKAQLSRMLERHDSAAESLGT